jgi:hypothetical protein
LNGSVGASLAGVFGLMLEDMAKSHAARRTISSAQR